MVVRRWRVGNHYDVTMRALLLLLTGLACGGAATADGSCPPEADAARQVLNTLRSTAQTCGSRDMAAAPALQWQPRLAESAARYAQELAARDRIDHVSPRGATLRGRLHEVGYVMRSAGENLAGGPETLDEALAQWLASPPHCENLMAPEFVDFGLACTRGTGHLKQYWVLHLAAPATPARSNPGRSP